MAVHVRLINPDSTCIQPLSMSLIESWAQRSVGLQQFVDEAIYFENGKTELCVARVDTTRLDENKGFNTRMCGHQLLVVVVCSKSM